ncbi:hypothetical protein [Pelomicrobium methylotrophicum]|uniref:hypothetical protein n=1 Tax=Pelomicrobium methylotrophicum TaxID=2602750 RepID=UPI001969BF4F|nr:hypothetical protein [Pelomicrobium methylotrophicum]
MAEIRNYTLNFSSGHAARLTFAAQRLAFAEIELRMRHASAVLSGKIAEHG